MIKKIEVWDFESHKHSVLELDEGLNFIVGESNSGKSSLVRAVAFVAYNRFDQRSVRVGAKFCRVRVETDKGYVDVKKGPKDNLWEVCRNGEHPEYLDKPGKRIVPQATEVLGLDMVRLGEVDVPVNIMDQLEAHFLLDAVGDKDASGSMRAQIVDEVSGLAGIEGIIRDVGLDLHRGVRSVNEIEADIKNVETQFHDRAELEAEKAVLGAARGSFDKGRGCLETAERLEVVAGDACAVLEGINEIDDRLEDIPETEAADDALKKASEAFLVVKEMDKAAVQHGNLSGSVADANDLLRRIPDAESAETLLNNVSRVLSSVESMQDRVESVDSIMADLDDAKIDLGAVPDTDHAAGLLKDAEKAFVRAESMAEVLSKAESTAGQIGAMEGDLAVFEEAMNDALEEQRRIIDSVKVCPLTGGPVADECLKQARGK